jgi:hypothetical protein
VKSRTNWMVKTMPTKAAVRSAGDARAHGPHAAELGQEVAAVDAAREDAVEDLAREQQRREPPPDRARQGPLGDQRRRWRRGGRIRRWRRERGVVVAGGGGREREARNEQGVARRRNCDVGLGLALDGCRSE